jgi:pimeloyl-ACP methyl ester carboxylesterase
MKLLALTGLFLASHAWAGATDYSFSVKVVGRGRPLILIPGLTCTGDVWDGTVERLKRRYQCHVLTLPGFGKQPPISGPYVERVRDDILAYVKEHKLNHPAVIGHSLGGFMIYELAEADPDLWGPLVAVDGVPFLLLLNNPKATEEKAKLIAAGFYKQLLGASLERFKAGIKANLTMDITDPKNVELMFSFCRDSDQADVAEAMKELLITDLRPGLRNIRSKFLLIGAGRSAVTDQQKAALTAAYSSEIEGLPNAKLEMDWKARHFVMLDDPDGFYSTIETFLRN